jgi:hypothetical protein
LAVGVFARNNNPQIITGNATIAVGVDDPYITSYDSDLVDLVTIEVTDDRLVTRLPKLGALVRLGPPTVAIRIQQPPPVPEHGDLIDAIAIPVTRNRRIDMFAILENVVDCISAK